MHVDRILSGEAAEAPDEILRLLLRCSLIAARGGCHCRAAITAEVNEIPGVAAINEADYEAVRA